MKKEIVSLLTGLAVLSAVADTAFTQVVKLRGDKGESPVFYLDDGKSGDKSQTLRTPGKAWSSVQITNGGYGVRIKKDMGQYLYGNLAFADKSFSCSLWMRPVALSPQYSAVVSNTTRPPCWGIRLLPVKPAGDFKIEVYYNWGIQGVPGQLMRAKSSFKTGSWYFLTIVFDRANELMSLYIDGQLAEKVKMPKEAPAFRNSFSVSSTPWFFDGFINNLTFYPSVLSPEAISAKFAEDKKLKDAGK